MITDVVISLHHIPNVSEFDSFTVLTRQLSSYASSILFTASICTVLVFLFLRCSRLVITKRKVILREKYIGHSATFKVFLKKQLAGKNEALYLTTSALPPAVPTLCTCTAVIVLYTASSFPGIMALVSHGPVWWPTHSSVH